MSKEQAQSEPIGDVLSQLREELAALRKENKGIKGQLGLIRGKVGLGRPGQAISEPEPSPNQAVATESKPQEAGKMHEIFEWMQECPECGGENKEYKPATVACSNCGVPLTSSPEIKKELVEKGETDKLKHCWNGACSSRHGEEWKVKIL